MDCYDTEIYTEAVDTSISKPIFVIFSDLNTFATNLVKFYMKTNATHVAISFDVDMHDVYGVGLKFEQDEESGNRHGFHREMFATKYENASIVVYTAYVSIDTFNKLKDYVDSFKHDKKSGKYDWSIILNSLLKIDKKFTKSEYTQICSTFVDAVFKQINVDLTGKEIPSPKDLNIAISERKPEFKLLYDGIGSDYDPKRLRSKLYSFTKTKYSKRLDE